MSMLFVMVGLTPTQITRLTDEPVLIKDLVNLATSEEGHAWYAGEIEALPPEARDRMKAELREGKTEHAQRERQSAAQCAEARQRLERMLGPIESPLGLGKLWHILHYVLAGSRGMTPDVIFYGNEVSENTGYGPPRLLDPEWTAYFSRYMGTFERQSVENSLNFHAMAEAHVYPLHSGVRDADYDAVLRKQVGRFLVRLQDYVSSMAQKGNGLLKWVH